MQDRNYRLRPDGEYIRFELKNGAGVDYFTPNRDFLSILNEWHFSAFDDSGRTRCYYSKSVRPRDRLYLYDLAIACYMGMAHADTLRKDIAKYFEWKNTGGLTVDHLDGNPHNNTVFNLALMPGSCNLKKMQFPSAFIDQYAVNMAYVGGEYRVQFDTMVTERDNIQSLLDRALPGRFKIIGDAGTSTMRFVCEDAEGLIKLLRHVYDSKFSWCNPSETVREYRRGHKGVAHFAADIRKSLSAQKALAEMNRGSFQIFRPGE